MVLGQVGITFELSGVELRSSFTSGGGPQGRNELERLVRFHRHNLASAEVMYQEVAVVSHPILSHIFGVYRLHPQQPCIFGSR